MVEEKKSNEDNGSGWDEAILPELQDAVANLVDFVCDLKPIDFALRSLSPGAVAVSRWLPNGIGYLSSKAASSLFKSPVWQGLFKDSVIHGGRHLRDKIQEKGGLKNVTPKEYGDAVRKGFQEAAEKKYVVIDGLLHSTGCARMQHRIKPQNKEQPSGNVEVTLLEAEQQHIMCAACCFEGVQTDIKATTAAPAKVDTVKPPRSPMEVLYRAKPEDRSEFLKLLSVRPVDERKRFDEFLKHMDTEEEFGMLLMIMKEQPEIASEMLTLLENGNSTLRTKQYLHLVGQAIERHSMEALATIKSSMKYAGKKAVEIDESFAPVAKRLRQNDALENPDSTISVTFGRKKPENTSFLSSAGRFVKSLFLFI